MHFINAVVMFSHSPNTRINVETIHAKRVGKVAEVLAADIRHGHDQPDEL